MSEVSGPENPAPRGDSLSIMPVDILRAVVIGMAKAFGPPLTSGKFYPLAAPVSVLHPEAAVPPERIHDHRAIIAQQIPRRNG